MPELDATRTGGVANLDSDMAGLMTDGDADLLGRVADIMGRRTEAAPNLCGILFEGGMGRDGQQAAQTDDPGARPECCEQAPAAVWTEGKNTHSDSRAGVQGSSLACLTRADSRRRSNRPGAGLVGGLCGPGLRWGTKAQGVLTRRGRVEASLRLTPVGRARDPSRVGDLSGPYQTASLYLRRAIQ